MFGKRKKTNIFKIVCGDRKRKECIKCFAIIQNKTRHGLCAAIESTVGLHRVIAADRNEHSHFAGPYKILCLFLFCNRICCYSWSLTVVGFYFFYFFAIWGGRGIFCSSHLMHAMRVQSTVWLRCEYSTICDVFDSIRRSLAVIDGQNEWEGEGEGDDEDEWYLVYKTRAGIYFYVHMVCLRRQTMHSNCFNFCFLFSNCFSYCVRFRIFKLFNVNYVSMRAVDWHRPLHNFSYLFVQRKHSVDRSLSDANRFKFHKSESDQRERPRTCE